MQSAPASASTTAKSWSPGSVHSVNLTLDSKRALFGVLMSKCFDQSAGKQRTSAPAKKHATYRSRSGTLCD